MNEKIYQILTYVRVILPALATLVTAVWGVWGLPYGEAIVATLTALSAFVNAIMMIDSEKFFSDKEIIEKSEEDAE